jgi:hypothetical protein
MKYLLPLSLTLILYSCSNNERKVSVVTAFENSGVLLSRIHKTSVPVLLPRSMFISNNKLFIYKEKENKLFHIFNLPDLTYICEAGDRGQGPNDFGVLDTRSFHFCQEGFNVLEAGSNILKTVIFKDDNLFVTHSERMLVSNISTNGFYPLADNVYLTLGTLVDVNEYNLFDKKTKTVAKTGDYPQWTLKHVDQPHEVFVTYLKSCAVHPDGKRFASFYGRFKRLRIYDNSASLLHDIDVRIEPYSEDIEEDIKQQYIYYIGQPYATSDHIYALCLNAKGNDRETANACELHVWNWEGKPIGCYKFDRRITLMALNEKQDKIYGLNHLIDNEIYIYDIPHLN